MRFRFGNPAPQKLTIRLDFQQQAIDEIKNDFLFGAGEEALGEPWELVVAVGVAMRRSTEGC
jgi:hypothetical protein